MVRFASGHISGRFVALGLVVSVAALAISTTSADARRHHRSKASHHSARAERYSPPYSDIVVDANSGKVMHETSADALRHPASLTKIMTLYLLFERLDAGKIKLSTPLTVSAHAASMAPSKLNLKPGETISVEDAIRAVVTKSANDVAVVIAENLGNGDEATFCRLMTKKAQALGMRQTTYRNASGLPNPGQITSARDQAILGRAIQERFPKYYAYFSTRSFTFRGHAIRNHNHLLGKIEGVDGIKTGYIAASGFNLVTSVHRDGRHLVAVVMGGHSANSRDARMRELISDNIVVASTRKTAPPIIDAPDSSDEPVVVASAGGVTPMPRPAVRGPARAAPAVQATRGVAMISSAEAAEQNPVVGSSEDLRPIPVKTVRVKAAALSTTPIGSGVTAQRQPVPAATHAEQSMAMTSAPLSGGRSPASGGGASLSSASASTVSQSPPQAVAAVQPAIAAPSSSSSASHEWVIQVGALESQKDAAERISAARSKAAKILAKAKSFTEKIIKNDMTLYRARFAVISRDEAESACKRLKSVKIVCIALRN